MAGILIKKISFEMVDSVAELHMTAFQGYTNTLIGIPYVRAFIRWFCEADKSVALCAIDAIDKPVGYAIGAPLGYATDLNKKILWPAVTGIMMRPWLVFNPRFRWIMGNKLRSFKANKQNQSNKMPILPIPAISLVGIGVHPEARGQGVGQDLLRVFESLAVESGFKSTRLSVYQDNLAACMLYTKAGWKPCNSVNEELLYYYKIFGSNL
jgi:ribosomal protein S18 acetylase RimI-like enzyme